ncbi:hypothetical protein CHCC4186_1958 [Bacillus paralicheniformis]|nr:hypothetical protein CHCC4186_1958 [Bacillus paralicheniformis]
MIKSSKDLGLWSFFSYYLQLHGCVGGVALFCTSIEDSA